MLESLGCRACLALLQPEDGHDLCPSCLGIGHLREGLTDEACTNCSVMPMSVRAARLAALEQPMAWSTSVQPPPLSAGQGTRRKRRAAGAMPPVPQKRSKGQLSKKVDCLSSELAEMKAVLQSFRAGGRQEEAAGGVQDVASLCEDDVISVAASGSFFQETQEVTPEASEVGSHASTSTLEDTDDSAASAIRTALAQLQLGDPPARPTASSAFFRRHGAAASFTVPPSAEYIKELHACWADVKVFSRPTSDARTLASMQEAPKFGLGHMPSVEPAVASLIVAPDEAMRRSARCPRPQCRVTDELLCRAYDAGARLGRMGNSLSHLLLGLASSLEAAEVDMPTQGLVDTSLQTFAFMSRELGRMLSLLTQARRQVWLAQSPLTETCRRTLRGLPVVPGELFGAAAVEALHRTAQAAETRQQLAGLHRRTFSQAVAGPSVTSFRPGAVTTGPVAGNRQPFTRSGRFSGDRTGVRTPQFPRSARVGRQPPRPSKGQRGRK